MTIEEQASGIYRIGVPLPNNPLKELNSYLIKGDESDLLIDTGFRCEECRSALEDGLASLGSDPSRRDVLLTHLHSDHSGNSADICAPSRRIWISAVDLDFIDQEMYGDMDERTFRRYESEDFPRALLDTIFDDNPAFAMRLPDLDDRFVGISDGWTVRVGEYELRAVSVPGHTPGNMMFWAERQGIMFCGDHVLFDITPNITRWEDVDDSLGNYLSSLERAKAYPVKLALPGHRHTGDYHARIDALAAHHSARIEEARSVVAAHPGVTAYETASMMRWRIRARDWESFPPTQKWFAVGECLSHLDYLCARGRLVRQQRGGVWRYSVA